MSHVADISDLIGTVYDAALDPPKWADVLSGLCRLTNCRASAMHLFNPQDNNKITFGIEYGTDPKWTELLHTTYAAICPLAPFMLMAEVDEPGSMFDFIDEPEFQETRFYREWCAPQDYYDMAGAVIAKTEREVGTLSLMRGRQAARFGAREREIIGLIAPHIRRAMTISGLLQHRAAEIESFSALLDTMSHAVLIVDASGEVIRTNSAAAEFLATSPLPGLNGSFGNGKLGSRLKEIVSQSNGRAELVPLSGERPSRLMAAVVPLDKNRRRFGIIIHTPEPSIPAMGKPLAAAYGLTPREVAVLMPLLEGQEPAQIAETLGVSLPTIRTHMSRLFAKTNTSRQSDLVRLVLQSMPPVRTG